MIKYLSLFTLVFTLFIANQSYTEEPKLEKSLVFTPPQGWQMADPKQLPPSVKAMIVGKGKSEYPPSMNLGLEEYDGNLKSYLKIVKSINDSQNAEWKDLGKIQTQAGSASLSQVDMRTEWGAVRLMHVILVRDGFAYILTAAAKSDEFPQFYNDFFTAMKSLRFENLDPTQVSLSASN